MLIMVGFAFTIRELSDIWFHLEKLRMGRVKAFFIKKMRFMQGGVDLLIMYL
jgi:hypothetical protein